MANEETAGPDAGKTPTQEKVKPSKKPWSKEKKIAVGVIWVAIAGFVYYDTRPPTPEQVAAKAEQKQATAEAKAAEKAKDAVARCHDEILAWINAKEIVTKNLKSPASADFGPRSDSTTHAYKDCKFEVSGWVDAQNSFGAKLRNRYTVLLQYQMDLDGWMPIKVDIH